MNMTVFLLKKFIFILNFSFFMCYNLGLFTQNWGLSTENNETSIFRCKSINSNTFLLKKFKHAHILFT